MLPVLSHQNTVTVVKSECDEVADQNQPLCGLLSDACSVSKPAVDGIHGVCFYM